MKKLLIVIALKSAYPGMVVRDLSQRRAPIHVRGRILSEGIGVA